MQESQSASTTETQVAIIGSGLAGLGLAIRMKQAKEDDFLIFERTNDVGGVWRENNYPGCACDVQSILFSLSFAPNPNWTRAYSPQKELWQYARDCATKFDLWRHIKLEHEVRDTAWEQATQRWRIETSRGVFYAKTLIMAIGSFSEPKLPPIPGIEKFQGPSFHSSRWDASQDLAGRNVAVIGTGASAIQIVPAIQPTVGKLSLFQRTPPWILPRMDFPIPSVTRRLFARVPMVQRAMRWMLYLFREMLALAFFYPRLFGAMRWVAQFHLWRGVRDKNLRAKLRPSYRLGCKRVLVSDDYYPSLTKPNVNVVTSGIREARERSIVTEDGVEHPVDLIVFGTGFHSTDPPFARYVRGRDGRTLEEVWEGSPKAFAGTSVVGFPNFFLMQGPNTGIGHTSVLLMIEAQIDHVIGAMRYMKKQAVDTIEPTPEAQAQFVSRIDKQMRTTVWLRGGCQSWYLDKTGRNSIIWPGFAFTFRRRYGHFDARAYRTDKADTAHHVRRPIDVPLDAASGV